VPDGAFCSANGVMTYVEVERSRKAQPALEAMLLNIARLLEKKPGNLCEVHIEPGIAERYISILKGWLRAGTFRAWSESTEGELFVSGIHPITPTLREAMESISFIHTRITP